MRRRDEERVVVVGTRVVNGLLARMLVRIGQKGVVQIDQANQIGGLDYPLNLNHVLDKQAQAQPDAVSRTWSFDINPRLILQCGPLGRIIASTGIKDYVSFLRIEGYFVLSDRKLVVPVPSNPRNLDDVAFVGTFSKSKFRNFISFCVGYDPAVLGSIEMFDPDRKSAKEMFAHFKLSDQMIPYILIVICFFDGLGDDSRPAVDVISRVKIFVDSQCQFLYPIQGFGALAEACARPNALQGVKLSLGQTIKSCKLGKEFSLIETETDSFECKWILGNKGDLFTSFEENRASQRLIRWILILARPSKVFRNKESGFLIVPGCMNKRVSNVFVLCTGPKFLTCPSGCVVTILAIQETENPKEELRFVIDLLGEYKKDILITSMIQTSMVDQSKNPGLVLISDHSPSIVGIEDGQEIIEMYRKITGESPQLQRELKMDLF